jgi:hypothetical protein
VSEKQSEIDEDIWMEVAELWRILRYKCGVGSHYAKLKAARHLENFLAIKVAERLAGESRLAELKPTTRPERKTT